MLGVALHALHDRHRHQCLLPRQELVEARTQIRPAFFGEREMATEVEQRHLAYLAADTAALHQAVGDIGFARRAVACGGGTDELAARITQ